MQNFHETINWLENNKKELKKYKNIGIYCTGGIRCDKLSFYLNESGYDNIFSLKGGIVQYINDMKNNYINIAKYTKNKEETINLQNKKQLKNNWKSIGMWKGDCFVFDDRIVLNY